MIRKVRSAVSWLYLINDEGKGFGQSIYIFECFESLPDVHGKRKRQGGQHLLAMFNV